MVRPWRFWPASTEIPQPKDPADSAGSFLARGQPGRGQPGQKSQRVKAGRAWNQRAWRAQHRRAWQLPSRERHGPPEPPAGRPIVPTENIGPGHRPIASHLAAEKPAAAPSIFPNGNARTAASPLEPAAVPLDLAASRRAARQGPPLDKAHRAKDRRVIGRVTSRQLLRDET
jgi:hypothetical protein